MKPKVLIAYEGHKGVGIEREILEAIGAEVIAAEDIDTPLAMESFADADALMVTIHKVTPEIMDRMPKCKIICRIGTGMDAIDISGATERGIWTTNVPDYSIDEVSTHAISLLLAQARNLFRHRERSQSGTWRYQVERPILRLAGQTLGVIGLGRIGSASARKGKGLGLRVIGYDPYLTDADFARLGVERVDFDTLLADSDYVTLHVPLSDATRKMINARALSMMKSTAFLINTARGEVVDIDALVDAVRAGEIAGAGIDVLPIEPPPADHPVLHEEGIIVTPHIAWASIESAHDVRVKGANEVVRVLQGGRPSYPWNEIGVEATEARL